MIFLENGAAAIRGLLSERPLDSHKGTYGHLLIIAGSPGFAGAAKLAAAAALRSGVGLVTVAVPGSLSGAMTIALTEAMSLALPESPGGFLGAEAVDAALNACLSRTTVVIGPGLSCNEYTRAFMRRFVSGCLLPLCIDADGLNCLAGDLGVLSHRTKLSLLTPHPGEMARLRGVSTAEIQADRVSHARALASGTGCVVALKGRGTLIVTPDGQCWRNTTGNPGMAKGGTGDVLAGLAGGLMAMGMDVVSSARLAVHLHGLAGDIAARSHTQRGMTAMDLVDCIPEAWVALEGA